MNRFALQCKEAKKQERNYSFSGDRLNRDNHDKAINVEFTLECRQIKSVSLIKSLPHFLRKLHITSPLDISILNEMQISKKHCSSRLHVKFQVLLDSFSIDKATGCCDPGQREQTQTEVSGYNGFNTCDGRSFCSHPAGLSACSLARSLPPPAPTDTITNTIVVIGVTAGSPVLRIDSVCAADASASRRQRDGEYGTNATGVYEPRNPGLEADPENLTFRNSKPMLFSIVWTITEKINEKEKAQTDAAAEELFKTFNTLKDRVKRHRKASGHASRISFLRYEARDTVNISSSRSPGMVMSPALIKSEMNVYNGLHRPDHLRPAFDLSEEATERERENKKRQMMKKTARKRKRVVTLRRKRRRIANRASATSFNYRSRSDSYISNDAFIGILSDASSTLTAMEIRRSKQKSAARDWKVPAIVLSRDNVHNAMALLWKSETCFLMFFPGTKEKQRAS
ncbi:hypothetical protein EAG_12057 [Camponotus floridanus]|uniref:Uncharacterized protein n=1 Tax=Camponotus floridanus TaxID=104421 RepID=E2AS51_CAMFO|nr:hypothetical protein EAG_12057 [Camponotus floridanus]